MVPLAHLLPARGVRYLIRHHHNIEGFLTATESVALFRAANRARPDSVAVEIGSWKGKSSYCIARGLRRGGRLHVIDPFDAAGEAASALVYASQHGTTPLQQQFEHNVAPLADRIVIHAGYSQAFVGQFPTIDLLMIDGDHSIDGARFDFEKYAPFVVSGGCVMFHDYYPERPDLGPTWVIDQLVKPSGAYREVEKADSLWIGRKI